MYLQGLCCATIDEAKTKLKPAVEQKVCQRRQFCSFRKAIRTNSNRNSLPPLLSGNGSTTFSSKADANLLAKWFVANSSLDQFGKNLSSIAPVSTKMCSIIFHEKNNQEWRSTYLNKLFLIWRRTISFMAASIRFIASSMRTL